MKRISTIAALVLLSSCVGKVGLDLDETGGPDSGVDGGVLPDGGGTDGDTGGPGEDGGGPGDVGTEVCMTPRAVFERETWPRAGKAVCSGCHLAGGVAEDAGSTFLLKSETALTAESLTLDEFYEYNLQQFRDHAELVEGMPKFLAKASAATLHEGGRVAPPDSDAYQALEALVTSFETEGEEECVEPPHIEPVDELSLLSPAETLRKATMMLGSRMPTQAELAAVDGLTEEEALSELDTALDSVMQGDAFHEWLKYAWNEVFMFRGLWELDVTFDFQLLSAQDFRARTWGFIGRNNFTCDVPWEGVPVWQRFGYESFEVCDNNLFGRDYMSKRVAWSLMEGPLELIAWIVETEQPFTEILTTDTVMMNYYSSVAYYGSAQPADNPWVAQHMAGLPLDTVEHPAGSTIDTIDLPFLHRFQPMNTMRRNRVTNPGPGLPLEWEYRTPEEYPRSGLLTDQLWLTRYPTTDTNVNRHRTWSFMLNFLGVDILALADRRGDPAAAELNSDQPTIDDPNCNVCHNVMDPVAGLFQDFGIDAQWNPNAAWPPRNQPNMLEPGISIIGPNSGAMYDESVGTTPIEWLGEQTIQDPRFAARMVRHAFLQLTGHEPMEAPTNPDTAGWRGRVRAYEVQSMFLSQLREDFIASNYDMKSLYKQIIVSPWFRARGLANPDAVDDADRLAATESFGDGDQLLTPFELHRKVEAILGRPWQHRSWVMRGNNLNVIDENAPQNDFLMRFNSENDFRYIDSIFRDMYGGIDFMNNTSRLVLPSSVMSAAARRVSNEVACATVAVEFGGSADDASSLFRSVSPGQPSADNPAIAGVIKELHRRMLGQLDPSDADVAPTVALYDNVLSAGQSALQSGQAEAALPAHCSTASLSEDPTYGIRAWMAVISYLALDPAFLYTW